MYDIKIPYDYWWWAIIEVLFPISEEPEYEDLISGQWWGTVGL